MLQRCVALKVVVANRLVLHTLKVSFICLYVLRIRPLHDRTPSDLAMVRRLHVIDYRLHD